MPKALTSGKREPFGRWPPIESAPLDAETVEYSAAIRETLRALMRERLACPGQG